MASGLRTKAEALSLAGCDFLVVVSARGGEESSS